MHIGVIPDGNRRYMEKKGVKSLFSSYDMGITQFHDFLTWCQSRGVDEVTIYALSLENIVNRDSLEIKTLLSVFNDNAVKSLEDKRIHENEIMIRICGDKAALTAIKGVGGLGDQLIENLSRLEEATKDYNRLKLNLAIGYGGRQEIVAAARKTVDAGKPVTAENIEENLWVSSHPDLIIRT
ncbi:MAG: hypothetical protein GF334_01790, partial [Candidatus Altiarchaeales archaeon]|nr:hypothetical protein [Candidatus Altiarchaeales archaeon]